MYLKTELFCFVFFIFHECLVMSVDSVTRNKRQFIAADETKRTTNIQQLQVIRAYFQHTQVCFQNTCPLLEEVESYVMLNQGYYKTLYDKQNKIPVYSAYVLPLSADTGDATRQDGFIQHPELSGQPQHNAYTGLQKANLDRGHLYPQSYISNKILKKFTNVFTNLALQNSILNQRTWRNLEGTLKLVSETNCDIDGAVRYFVTGVIPSPKEKPKFNGMNIPDFFWTAICCDTSSVSRAEERASGWSFAYIVENKGEEQQHPPINIYFVKDFLQSAKMKSAKYRSLYKTVGPVEECLFDRSKAVVAINDLISRNPGNKFNPIGDGLTAPENRVHEMN